jgi:hypothetical protein
MATNSLQLDPWATSLAAAQANVLASSTKQVQLLNDNLKTIYLGKFNDWTISVLAGRIDNTNPPQPPKAYTLETTPDGFSFPAPGNDPVCAMPPVPPDYSKPQVQAVPEPENVRNVPAGDTMPVGYILTAPDGGRWQKQSSTTPFGVAYFYARVA